ncbi:Hypothetical protein CINCED_3A022709 [Cinara cedri]|uniref:Ribosomal protein S11 n=1 Tax=Cinara cedri TaxID=506608 RepID=A0A5E4N2N9_9HEMI|nr:Hypothetical protein CINCED_3A022709 [Cinara cedri]
MFPDMNTSNMLFGGIKFSDIPICHIKSSKNNTILHVTKPSGERIMIRSCGMEGFKNTRKGTNIAAQATAIGLATRVLELGIHTVRVTIQGLGPGRMVRILSILSMGLVVWWDTPTIKKHIFFSIFNTCFRIDTPGIIINN